jgi:hypothetical protein
MSKHERDERGPADAWNDGKVIKPTNTSKSLAKGGSLVRRLLEEHDMYRQHPAGGTGSQQPLDEDGAVRRDLSY